MRTVIELNETDIALIIADKYKCDINLLLQNHKTWATYMAIRKLLLR